MWGYDESLYLKRLFMFASKDMAVIRYFSAGPEPPAAYALCGSRFKPLALQAKVPSSTLGQGTNVELTT